MGCVVSEPYTGPVYDVIPVDGNTYVTAKDKLVDMVRNKKNIVVVLFNKDLHIQNISRSAKTVTLTLKSTRDGLYWQEVDNDPGIYLIYC